MPERITKKSDKKFKAASERSADHLQKQYEERMSKEPAVGTNYMTTQSSQTDGASTQQFVREPEDQLFEKLYKKKDEYEAKKKERLEQ